MVALVTMLLFTQPSLAVEDDHRALKLLLNNSIIITQQEYDQAVQEEERKEQCEKQANGVTKDGLQLKLRIPSQAGHCSGSHRNRWPASLGIRGGDPPPAHFGSFRDASPPQL